MSVIQDRLQRVVEDRKMTASKLDDIVRLAEENDGRDLTESEQELANDYRKRIAEFDAEIDVYSDDVQREQNSRDVSALIRVRDREAVTPQEKPEPETGAVYRTFSQYARDELIVRYPVIARLAGDNDQTKIDTMKARAQERLSRALENTVSGDNEGLLPPVHMAEIMDIIDTKRPVINAGARRVDLSRGKLTYPKIEQRPDVQVQGTEKTQAGSLAMKVTLEDLTADTYLGGGNISWQTINWSTPDALQLWFSLAAESYAMETETAACDSIGTAGLGTVSPALGTAGTESLADWRRVTIAAIGAVYTATGGRARTNTLYLSADQFFSLAALATDQVLQMSAVGNLDTASLTGTFSGLRVVGSYGFAVRTRIIGDSSAFLVGETPGAPVEMRAVEPAIGGMEVGVIGAFKSKVFDEERFLLLNTPGS